MEIDHDIPTVLAVLRTEAPSELAGEFYTMEDLWERRLWHQLTDVLVRVFAAPASGPVRMRLFVQFVSTFEAKVNQLKLVGLALLAADERVAGTEDSLAFMDEIARKVQEAGAQDAYVYALIEVARIRLVQKDLDGALATMDKANAILDTFDAVDKTIHAAYYRVNADYYKAKSDFAAYYRHSLRYLACISLADLPAAEQRERAYDLAVAALLGETIYNFGEILLHPVLESLRTGETAWLRDALFAFHSGDIPAFEALLPQMTTLPILASSAEFLRQKICLMALIEAVFKRPPSDRTLPFATIATETRLVLEEVEHLVMKALSLGLLRGSIDQVAQTVTITWLQPRVMTKDQIESMRQRLVDWDASVSQLSSWMEGVGKDIWAVV
ncbi:uncharacterized protein V1510DRAFT_422816 [Dipodascopsis tothii]|uniref:uncharacterized protein n=1 Tax=Dipodascopsis tothii TaxID=44089 RepID=UPI0034CD07C0